MSFCFTYSVNAQNLVDPATLTTAPVTETSDLTNALSFSAGYSSLTSDIDSASGMDFSFRYQFALDNKWGLAAEASQGLNISGFGTLYSALSAVALYSLGGDLIRGKKITYVGNQPVATQNNYTKKGWVLHGGIKQYFFNGTNSVLPFVGPTIGASYQFSSSKILTLFAGASYDMGQNDDRTLSTLKIYLGTLGFR